MRAAGQNGPTPAEAGRTSRLAYSLLPTLVVVLVLTAHTVYMTNRVELTPSASLSASALTNADDTPDGAKGATTEDIQQLHARLDEVLTRLNALSDTPAVARPVVDAVSATSTISDVSDANATNNTPTGPQMAIPDLFIYRRTKKTGSSSMLTALLSSLVPLYNYTPLYLVADEMTITVRHEYSKPSARRLFIAQHNGVKRDVHPRRNAVIADTFRDGYDQITSYCRYVKEVSDCTSDEMAQCLERKDVRAQREYRWAGRDREDRDTYIDLPLSSAHPALSTTVLQSFFGPNVTLDVHEYNVFNSSCGELPKLRRVYDDLYSKLEADNTRLAKRLLVLAGYTTTLQGDLEGKVSTRELLDAAEALEKKKYGMDVVADGEGREVVKTKRQSDEHRALNSGMRKWIRDEEGILRMEQRF